jgi:hypothetical protein
VADPAAAVPAVEVEAWAGAVVLPAAKAEVEEVAQVVVAADKVAAVVVAQVVVVVKAVAVVDVPAEEAGADKVVAVAASLVVVVKVVVAAASLVAAAVQAVVVEVAQVVLVVVKVVVAAASLVAAAVKVEEEAWEVEEAVAVPVVEEGAAGTVSTFRFRGASQSCGAPFFADIN